MKLSKSLQTLSHRHGFRLTRRCSRVRDDGDLIEYNARGFDEDRVGQFGFTAQTNELSTMALQHVLIRAMLPSSELGVNPVSRYMRELARIDGRTDFARDGNEHIVSLCTNVTDDAEGKRGSLHFVPIRGP